MGPWNQPRAVPRVTRQGGFPLSGQRPEAAVIGD